MSFSLWRNKNSPFKVLLLAGLFVSVQGVCQHDLKGLVIENDRYNQLPIHPAYGKFQRLPASFSNKQNFPRVVNQSLENNAVAWAVTWYGMGALQKKTSPGSNLALSPSFTYRACKPGTKDCKEPVSMIDALVSLTENGAPSGSLFGLYCADAIPPFVLDSARRNKLSGYARLFNTFDSKSTKVQAIKRAVVMKNPVVVGIICPASFQLARDFWQPREKPLPENGGHALCIVGYDDNRYGGAFEIVNSWGRTWGNQGYSWLRYDDAEAFVLYGFEMMTMPAQLSASLDFITNKGEEMKVDFIKEGEYKFARRYKTGEQFQLKVNSPGECFVRVLAVDPAGQIAALYPETEGVLPLAMEKVISIPTSSPYLELQGAPGTNKIVVFIGNNLVAIQQEASQFSRTGLAALAGQRKSGTWFRTKAGFQNADGSAVLQIELIQE